MEPYLFVSVIQIAACTALLFASLLWMQRGDRRSRIYLSIACAFYSVDLFVRAYNVYGCHPLSLEILHSGHICMSLIQLTFFLFYILSAVCPSWLNRKRVGWICSPSIVWSMLMLTPGLHFQKLNTHAGLYEHIGDFNVWIRLLFVFFMLALCMPVYLTPSGWHQSDTPIGRTRLYGVGIALWALLFVLSTLSGSVVLTGLHLTCVTLFCFCTGYAELFIRLQAPGEGKTEAPVALPVHDSTAYAENTTDELQADETTSELWNNLKLLMQTEMPWRNPDFTILDLATSLQTNRTTLWNEIKANGYRNFHDLIAFYRIKELCNRIDENLVESLDSAFFEVGFRSRTTAYERFKERTGITPKEYMLKK